MSPDTEILSSLKPDWILSPVSLQSDLQPKYEAIGSDWAFLNIRSVPGMYRSIQELGEIFDRQDQADKLVKEFTEFYDDYKKKNEGKDHPKVMILMGLPGSVCSSAGAVESLRTPMWEVWWNWQAVRMCILTPIRNF